MKRERGAILIVVLMILLLVTCMATAFVNFQVSDRRLSQDDVNSQKAFYMADSGIQLAMGKICRDINWQGQNRFDAAVDNGPVTEWVYQEGTYKCGFMVQSQFLGYIPADPAKNNNYYVRSTGVVVDVSYSPPRLIASRCVKAYIQCANDYNPGHDGQPDKHYTPVGTGNPAILWRFYDEYK
ncbi:MAG: PilX N-terminal domain-containing pilus assembly protein [Candidatus Eremiobacteraeota bacterium]|nr:PilX N-terminal domain-containing pilus assembly protein [Candidatus Eremiobacteraeota bacterium]